MTPPKSTSGRAKGGGEQNTTPPAPEGPTAPYSNPDQHSWLLQTIFEMQGSLGRLTECVDGLRQDVKAQGERLESVQRVLYAAYILGGVMIIIGGFVLNKAWDPLMSALVAYAKSRP